jgi:hypothetical protein
MAVLWSMPGQHSGQRDENVTGLITREQARGAGDLGGKPLAVVTAGSSGSGWLEQQDDLATLSSNAAHRVVLGATHLSLVTEQRPAGQVVAAVVAVVEAARTGGQLH